MTWSANWAFSPENTDSAADLKFLHHLPRVRL